MMVTVKFFAILRDRAGASESRLELVDGDGINQAMQELTRVYPSFAPFISKLAYAVNEEYVPADTKLHDGDELALIPPVSGG